MQGFLRSPADLPGQGGAQHPLGSPATVWRKLSKLLVITVLVAAVVFAYHSWSPGGDFALGITTDAKLRASKTHSEQHLAHHVPTPESKPVKEEPSAKSPQQEPHPQPKPKPKSKSNAKPTKAPSAKPSLEPTPDTTTPSEDTEVDTKTKDHKHVDRRLVVLTPANKGDPNLCKFMVSAIALGYPSPIIINWGRDPFEFSKWEGGPNLSKISGIMRYLDAVLHPKAHPDEALHKDDIVIIADAFDVWFQLPPEVLLKRYHQINARAIDRLRQQWPYEEKMPMQQDIVLACAKKCWPGLEAHVNLHCDELPESPLPKDLYGPGTDVFNVHNFQKTRPRYINGGVYVGAAGALRRMFRRAYDKVDSGTSKGIHLFSEQGVTGEILGEQEMWRNWRRAHKLEESEAIGLIERDYEYHMGLDYSRELSYATVHSEPDGAIIALSNKSGIAEYSTKLGISPIRVKGVPKDVKALPNPLKGLPNATTWENMPLYTDFYTDTVPALLHHNAAAGGMKKRREWWWDQTWFFPHLRDLLARNLVPGELKPLAEVQTPTRNITYWAPGADEFRRRPRLLLDKAFEPLKEVQFDDVCRPPDEYIYVERHWWDEVFRDGKGPI